MKLIHGECLEEMRKMDDNSIDLIATDPPYFKVKGEYWDNQWDTSQGFIDWIGELCKEWQRILKPNGSIYVFASPKMSWAVEGEMRKWFNVLTNIRWQKPAYSTKAEMFTKEKLRSPFPASESIIFAEHFNSDNIAKGEAGYNQKCDELRGFVFEPLIIYFSRKLKDSGYTTKSLSMLVGWNETKLLHYTRGGKDWWRMITKESYNELYPYLLFDKSYEDLRREYEDLRQEYEELRRPFNATPEAPYTDVWTFKTVSTYKGKHPCEKPLEMMRHIVRMSSREGATVLDCFMGSGSTGEACKIENREFIGIELDDKYYEQAEQRLYQKLLI